MARKSSVDFQLHGFCVFNDSDLDVSASERASARAYTAQQSNM